jgi:hypothetical protein
MRKIPPKKKWVNTPVRMPLALKRYLMEQAINHGVSVDFEIMVRLEQSTDRCFACGHFLDPAKG